MRLNCLRNGSGVNKVVETMFFSMSICARKFFTVVYIEIMMEFFFLGLPVMGRGW